MDNRKVLVYAGVLLVLFASFMFSISSVFAQACTSDAECGFTGYFGSEFCNGDDVYKQYQIASCENNECSVVVEERLVNDCDDGDSSTIDSCAEDSEIAYCNHELVSCVVDDDCGDVTEHFFCKNDDVWHRTNSPMCSDSLCNIGTSEELYEECELGCNNAQCITNIACYSDSDCVDFANQPFCKEGDLYQTRGLEGVCLNPGTPASSCEYDVDDYLVEKCELGCEFNECIDDNKDDDGRSRGGIDEFEDLDFRMFREQKEPVYGVVIEAPNVTTLDRPNKTVVDNGFELSWLFWMFVILVIVLLILILIVFFARR